MRSPAKWWQDYCAGRLMTPRALYRAASLVAEDSAYAEAAERFFIDPKDGPTWDVPERLKAPSAIKSSAALSQHNRADWQNADPRLMRWAALFVELARRRQIPLYVHACFRTPEQQTALQTAGRSRAKAGRSPHNIGEAVDIVHGVFHWNLTRDEWKFLHVLGQLALDRVNAPLRKADKLALVWGGGFKTLYDPAHWEVEDFRKRLGPRVIGPPVRRTPRGILAPLSPFHVERRD